MSKNLVVVSLKRLAERIVRISKEFLKGKQKLRIWFFVQKSPSRKRKSFEKRGIVRFFPFFCTLFNTASSEEPQITQHPIYTYVDTLALTARRPNHLARSHPLLIF